MLRFGVLLAFTALASANLMSPIIDQDSNEQISAYLSAARKSCPESCLKEKNDGLSTCSHYLKRWFYNKESNKCESFQYTGCRGNSNRFDSKKACKERCQKCNSERDETTNGSGLPTCDCSYRRFGLLGGGGCRITHGSPGGYKCHCHLTSWRWSCTGLAMKCSKQESCPADCTSRKCCLAGAGSKGNCGGYIKDSGKNRLQKLQNYRDCIVSHSVPAELLTDQNSNASYYELLNRQWNLRIKKVYPIAYFLPRHTKDVQSAVRCGFENQVPVVANSGGHSYEALSCGTDDSIIIDFRRMQKIALNHDVTVEVQPGALVGQITMKLWQSGYALPMGTCLTVGIGGQVIGGGEGYLVSMYGTALDNVLEFTVVDARGRALIANANENPDLYWAFRGIGPGYFGIVTRMKLRVYDVKNIQMTFVQIRWPVNLFANVLDSYQKFLQWVDENEPNIMTGLFATNDNRTSKIPPVDPGLQIQALHIQDVNHTTGNATFLKKLKEIFPPGGKVLAGPLTYMQLTMKTGYAPVIWNGKIYSDIRSPGAPTVDQLTKDIAIPRYHRSQTLFVKDQFTLDELEGVGNVVKRIPQNVDIMLTPERGAILKYQPSDTAYVHRTSRYQITTQYEGVEASEPIKEKGIKWLYEFFHSIQFMDGGETYQNYPDLSLQKDGVYLKRHWGTNLPKLMDVKTKFDPTDYFNQKLSIPLRT